MGRLAVFRYAVPQDRSHYDIKYCCFTTTNSWHMYETFLPIMARSPSIPTLERFFASRFKPRFRPAIPSPGDVLVEYGSVGIGGQEYICPTKSVSISRAMDTVKVRRVHCADFDCTPADLTHAQKISVNDTVYHSYHVFRSDIRIPPAEDSDAEGDSTQPASSATTAPKH